MNLIQLVEEKAQPEVNIMLPGCVKIINLIISHTNQEYKVHFHNYVSHIKSSDKKTMCHSVSPNYAVQRSMS